MRRVGVTRRLPAPGIVYLKKNGFRVDQHTADRPMTPAELRRMAARCDGLISQLVDKIDADLFAQAPGLRVVANFAVGYDNIDAVAASQKGIVVTNTPDVLTDATADLAWALLLAAARRVPEGDELMRAGLFRGWAPLLHLGQSLAGKTMGIIGAGRIGAAVGRRALGFGMSVVYWNRSPKKEFEKSLGARRVSLARLLKMSDAVSIHVPLSSGTRHLIGAAELRAMKPTAVLVNTARGPVVDEAALVAALKKRTIFAAGLDVFEEEPKIHPGLIDLPNVVLAPHAGSATVDTRAAMSLLAARNVVAVLQGKKPVTPVPFPGIRR